MTTVRFLFVRGIFRNELWPVCARVCPVCEIWCHLVGRMPQNYSWVARTKAVG